MPVMFGAEYRIVTGVLLCRLTREQLEHASERLEYLIGALMSGLDGFLSATLERSIHNDAVIVFSQWLSQQHHAAMLKDESVRMCLHDVELICKSVDIQVYENVKNFERMGRVRSLVGKPVQENSPRLQ